MQNAPIKNLHYIIYHKNAQKARKRGKAVKTFPQIGIKIKIRRFCREVGG